jgi:pyruvate dehydrogenase E2 component (dihydrolipoamide acetyltransferase)
MSTFRLPDLGEGLAEAEIVEWHVKVGDHVRVDQPMVSVETAKAVVGAGSFQRRGHRAPRRAGDIVLTGRRSSSSIRHRGGSMPSTGKE